MRHFRTLLIGFLALFLLSGLNYYPSRAQDIQPPLIVNSHYELFVYDGNTITPLAGLADIELFEIPYIASDNQHLAFRAVAQLGDDMAQAGAIPTSIGTYDLETNQLQIITTQPEDAYHTAEGTNAIVRSDPAWSPDGNYLLWSEIQITQATLEEAIYAFVIYDIAQSTTLVIELDIPPQGPPSPLFLWAGRTAIAIEINDFGYADASPRFLFYDYAGNYLHTVEPIGPQEDATPREDYCTWVQSGIDDYFAVGYTEGIWVLLSSDNDTQIPYAGGIELHNPLVPDGYFMVASFYADQLESGKTVNRLMATSVRPDGVEISMPNPTVLSLDRFAIAPDASAGAYLNHDQEIYIATDENIDVLVAENFDPIRIVWGYAVWQLPENAVLQN